MALTVAQRKAELEQVYRAKHAGFSHLIRLALNEAEALAWETGFPQLVFNGLAEEKIQAVASWNRRQSEIRQNRSAELSLAA